MVVFSSHQITLSKQNRYNFAVCNFDLDEGSDSSADENILHRITKSANVKFFFTLVRLSEDFFHSFLGVTHRNFEIGMRMIEKSPK